MNKSSISCYSVILFAVLFNSLAFAQPESQPSDLWGDLLAQSTTTQWYGAPNGEQTAILHQINYPSLATLAQPSRTLAGETFYTEIASRPNQRLYSHITVIKNGQYSKTIQPDNGVIIDYSWAPDSSALALLIQSDIGVHLWNYDVAQHRLISLSQLELSTRIGERHLRWLPDSSAVIVKVSIPSEHVLATNILQPRISSTDDKVKPGRTYKHLLNSPDKQRAFKSISRSQLTKIDRQGNSLPIADSGLIYHFAISPDGNYLLIEKLPSTPSSTLPLKKWGREYSIVDLFTKQHVYSLPSLGNKPHLAQAKDRVAMGARGVQWLPFKSSTISWVEASEQGLMTNDQSVHDRVYSLTSPFLNEGKEVLALTWRYYDLIWSPDGIGLLQEWRYQDRQSRTQLLKYQQPEKTRVLSQRDYRDKYADIGDPMTTRTPAGNRVLLEGNEKQIYMKAMGRTNKGLTPFIDTHNLYTNSKERIFTGKESALEIPLAMHGNSLIISSESVSKARQYISLAGDNYAKKTVIYKSEHQNMISSSPQIINYQRQDGLQLQGTLHLPNGVTKEHLKSGKIPAVLWVYPKAFKNIKISQQSSTVPNQFRQFDPLGPLPLLHDNIAVFEAPSMPIMAIGNGEPNDQFIAQLTMNAEAAVKALEQTGIIDVKRLAVMGHSYGAFAVANLLAHTDLFSAGIARSGAYNRTLTPFGFQGEKRNLWQANQTYLMMSPFLFADKINEPILLVHGEKDLNPGTSPMQSTRMYNALASNNKTAKLIILPYEGHQYRAKENLQQLLIQQSEWLARWLTITQDQ
ncbi:alpha/beta hydrolase family protein [Shewanella sp. 0m-8]